MEDLLGEYKESLKAMNNIRKTLESEGDKKIINSMISELQYVIKWLKNNQEPVAPKSRITMLAKDEHLQILDFENAFGAGGCPFEEVERRLDGERGVARNGRRRRNTGRFRR